MPARSSSFVVGGGGGGGVIFGRWGGQVSPRARRSGGGDVAEMPRRPHRVRVYGKRTDDVC